MKRSNVALLLLVPALVLVFNLLFIKNQRRLYMSWTDPSYAYLFNGMNLANGKLVVGHIDHPGTTVQEFAGVVLRATYIVSGEKDSLTTDLLSNPEKYLHAACYANVFLNCLVLLFCGYVILKRSGSIALALFIQSGAVIFFTTLAGMPDLRPEGFLVMGTMLLMTTCISFLCEKEISPKKMRRYAVQFGLVCAFLVVTKVTSLPLLLLPVFLLPKWKSWFVYGFTFVAATIFLLIPALKKMIYFFLWTKKLFFHSGIYGSGEEKIIDATAFRESLEQIFTNDVIFSVILVLLLVTLLALVFTKRLNKSVWKNDARVRLMAGIFLAMVICVLMVAKHFKLHYLIPAYCIALPGAWLALQFLPVRWRMMFSNTKMQLAAVIVFIAVFACWNARLYYFYPGLMNPKMDTANEMAKYGDEPRIYVTLENYSAEVSPALLFGLAYCGETHDTYVKELKEIYPKSYFFAWDQQRFLDWENTVELDDIVERYPKILVSFYYTDEAIIQGTIDRMLQLNHERQIVSVRKVYQNARTGEQLYELTRTEGAALHSDPAVILSCDAETTVGNSLVSSNQEFRLQGSEAQSTQAAHSGKYSLALDKQKQYGLGYQLPVKKGFYYELTIWRKSASGRGVLVVSGKDANALYRSSSTVVEDGTNGWQKIRLKFQLPEDYKDSTVSVFAWNENLDETIYFDDLEIREYQ